jgi:tRNA A37 N6-isopentenylltransferase MiaA
LAANSFRSHKIIIGQINRFGDNEFSSASAPETIAKRQLTWFRRHGNCEWIELKPDESAEAILPRLN